MKAADVARELIYPFTELAILFAMITFAILAKLALATPLGLFLLVVITPAFFRYALYLLEARAHGQEAPVPGIEIFNLVDSFWTLFPAIFLCLVVWSAWFLTVNFSLAAAEWALAIFFVIYPASMAVLGVTRSPVDSLNPVVILRMIRVCGRDYVWIPLALIAVMLLHSFTFKLELPQLVQTVIVIYNFFLVFTLTGAVLYARKVVEEVDIDLPLEASDEELARDLLHERGKVANHAYGFISRGNRDGGFAHIRQWITGEADREGAHEWFFREMLNWESTDPALFFAQEYVGHLLRWHRETEAMKVISTCLHHNPRWRPQAADREAVSELLTRHGRADLLTALKR